MLHPLLLILACQLAGETVARASDLPLPGPVLGMVLMLLILIVQPKAEPVMRPVAGGILAHMSVLFVPAGVGVVGHIGNLGAQTIGLLVAMIVSTALAMIVGALTFAGVARLTGSTDD